MHRRRPSAASPPARRRRAVAVAVAAAAATGWGTHHPRSCWLVSSPPTGSPGNGSSSQTSRQPDTSSMALGAGAGASPCAALRWPAACLCSACRRCCGAAQLPPLPSTAMCTRLHRLRCSYAAWHSRCACRGLHGAATGEACWRLGHVLQPWGRLCSRHSAGLKCPMCKPCA